MAVQPSELWDLISAFVSLIDTATPKHVVIDVANSPAGGGFDLDDVLIAGITAGAPTLVAFWAHKTSKRQMAQQTAMQERELAMQATESMPSMINTTMEGAARFVATAHAIAGDPDTYWTRLREEYTSDNRSEAVNGAVLESVSRFGVDAPLTRALLELYDAWMALKNEVGAMLRDHPDPVDGADRVEGHLNLVVLAARGAIDAVREVRNPHSKQ